MKIANVRETDAWFQVLQTSRHSQTAVMKLDARAKSSEEMNVHEKSDQVLLVIEGSVEGEIGGRKCLLQAGDVCVVPAGTRHRFANVGNETALTFNVYSPPEYPPGEKG